MWRVVGEVVGGGKEGGGYGERGEGGDRDGGWRGLRRMGGGGEKVDEKEKVWLGTSGVVGGGRVGR